MNGSIRLKRKEDLRIRAGHLWVFSNEIQDITGTPAAGDIVEVADAGGRWLGSGMYNPHSLIAARLLSFDESRRGSIALDSSFFRGRITAAQSLRTRLFGNSTAYRLVHSESDLLPGLVIDRYNDVFSVQAVSAGMDQSIPVIADVLSEMFGGITVIERNDSPLRELEQLPLQKRVVRGENHPVVIELEGVRHTVAVLEGQKTGFYLDQRLNRSSVERMCAGANVLDCFTNDGGFALHAAKAGAGSVTAVDASGPALERAESNARLNGFGEAIDWVEGDVFRFLEQEAAENKSYDVVILDPPSFTRSRKNVPAAKAGYRQLHQLAVGLLKPGGFLATASCSHHIHEETFLEAIQQGAQKAGKRLATLEWRGASPDHPVLPSMPETRYLKFGLFCVQ